MILEKNADFDSPDKYNLSGLMLMEEEGKIKVYQVIKGSPAERAKIKEGDEILFIDKISVSNYSLQQIRDILNQNEKSKTILEIESLDKTKEVKLTLKKMI